jgi:hypothetical protein
MPGFIIVFGIIVMDSLVFVSQVTVEVDKVLVDPIDQLVAFIQTAVQIIVHAFIVVLF